MRVGIRDSRRWQASVRPALSGCRIVVHCEDVSPKDPLVRMMPPSDDSKICVGFDGFTTSSCWSGWIEFGANRQGEMPGSAHQLAGSLARLPAAGGPGKPPPPARPLRSLRPCRRLAPRENFRDEVAVLVTGTI